HCGGVVCRKLGLEEDSDDRVLFQTVVGFQHVAGIPAHGEVDIVTARALGEEASLAPPVWWAEGMGRADLLGRYGLTESALRRVEGNHSIRPGGGQPVELAKILSRLFD